MKIRCLNEIFSSTSKQKLKENQRDPYSSLKEGEIYTVYALGLWKEGLEYCICDDSYSYYPWWHPASIFEIVDHRLSRYWIFNFLKDDNEKIPFMSFPEWANDIYFYGELVEYNSSDPNGVIFDKYKNLMDLEFSDPTISDVAQIGDDEWLICPDCIDAWKSKDDKDALIECPKCEKIFNNPRYKDEYPHL